jgi:putative ABC transport system permease protein
MRLLEMMRTALTALRAHKLRTTLSVLGIVIGVAAVVAIIALVNGATAEVKEQIAGLGMRTITVNIFPTAISSAASTRALTEELTSDILAAPSVSEVVPTATSGGSAILDGETRGIQLLGVTPDYMNLFDEFHPVSGRFIHPLDDDRTVAVLGASIAEDFFGVQDPVGQRLTLEVWGQKTAFQVIGVMSERGRVGYQDLDGMVYIPLSTAQRLSGSRQFSSYIAQAASESVIEQAAAEIESILDRTIAQATGSSARDARGGGFSVFGRGGRTPYNVQIQKEAIETYEESVNTMTLILGGVGAISLLVGGIGIMNILLVSVTERTREIGIRMAIGARPQDVRAQFLVESILISFIGGLLGLGFGWLCAWLGSLLGGWPFVISIYPALLACGFSLLIGVTFGLYPALRAARLDPVEALRYE